jgi:hypothetical protein
MLHVIVGRKPQHDYGQGGRWAGDGREDGEKTLPNRNS